MWVPTGRSSLTITGTDPVSRVVVYGVGAIGGVVAAALSIGGTEVVGIARGAQLQAIREGGLRLLSPTTDTTARFDCVGDPTEISWRADDLILLCMKTQDTLPALDRLRAAGVENQHLFCLQNGVTNERLALRGFANVHGVTVMMPGTFQKPGEVAAHSTPSYGMFDLGRFPLGHDEADALLAQALEGGNIAAFVQENVMESKYGKLLMNLDNITQAALGAGVDQGDLPGLLRAEGEAALAAAGIAWSNIGKNDPRREKHMQIKDVSGVPRVGGSTAQSLLRGAGSVETDYLNGEIVYLGRLHGVATPLNSGMLRVAARLAREGGKPGQMTLDDLKAELARAS